MHNISNFEIDELQQQKIIRLQFACNHQNWKNLARSDECNFSFEVHMARSQSGTNSMKKLFYPTCSNGSSFGDGVILLDCLGFLGTKW